MKQNGFTLIELLTICTITSIIIFFGTKSYAFIMIKSQVNTDKYRLMTMIRIARHQSINATSTMALCPSIDTKVCVRNWKLPIILFNDSNKNKKRDDNEPIIQQFSAFDSQKIIINYPKSQIRFNENGMANYYNGTLSYCNHEYVEAIVISRVGRIRFAQDLDGDHIPDVNRNTPVTCG